MNPGLVKVFTERFSKNEFPGIESKIITCFEVESLRKKFFGTKIEYTGIVLTPEVLFWGMANNVIGPFAAAAQLKEISEIRDYENTESCKIMQDHGIEIFGFNYQASRRGTSFIGLGDDESGAKCRKVLRELWKAKTE